MSKIPVGVKVLLVLGLMTGPALAQPMFLVDDDPPPGSVAAKINAVQTAVTASASFLDYDGSTAIDFGDYFAFADKFGLATGDTGFDAAYDADGSGKVEYGDFFIFGDNFGANAADAIKYDPPGPGTGPFANAAATFELWGPPADEDVEPGQTFEVDVDAIGLAGVEQYEIILELDPPAAFDLANSSFANSLTSAITLGIESPGPGQFRSGAAILSGTPFTGDGTLGTFTLKTSPEFANDATVKLGRVAVGSSSTEQDVFLAGDLNLSFSIAPRVRISGLQREAIFPDEPLNIFAQITPGDAAIASFQAKIRPDNSLTPLATLSLADDGAAPDATAGDQTYSAQWSGSNQLGNYLIDLLAEDINSVSLPVSAAAGFAVAHTIVSMPNKMLISPEELSTSKVPVLIEDNGNGYLSLKKFKAANFQMNLKERDILVSNLATVTTGTQLDGLLGTFVTPAVAWDSSIDAWRFDLSLTHTDSLELSGGPGPDQKILKYADLDVSLETPGDPRSDPGALNFDFTGVSFDDISDGIGILCCGQVEVGRGDVDTSGTIEAFDASLALMHTVRRINLEDSANELNDLVEADYAFTLPLYAGHMADVSGEMGITALDAALILQREVGAITHFPSEADYYRLWEPPDWWNPPTPPPTKPIATSAPPQRREIILGPATLQEDGSLAVPVLIDDMEGVLAGTFALTFLPHHLQPIGVRATELTRDYLFADHSWADSLRFSFAGATSKGGSGPVAELLLRRLDAGADLSTALALTEVQLNEGRIEALFQAGSALPTVLALYPNYPNPFNPQTTLRYDLPLAGQVRLTIYNLVGQRVRTLVDRHQQAGHYRLTWDGRNDAGFAAASGLYLYRLESKTGSLVRKMLMVK
mgnify:FL=1|jgi:hypothetical protein